MPNAQADSLRKEVLGLQDDRHAFVGLKPVAITSKGLKRLTAGALVDRWDPCHLRIVQGDRVLARAKLGQAGGVETIHIVATDEERQPDTAGGKKHLLEARLRLWDGGTPNVGDLIEYPAPLSRSLLVLVDHRPYALAEMVGYEGEPAVRITEVFGG